MEEFLEKSRICSSLARELLAAEYNRFFAYLFISEGSCALVCTQQVVFSEDGDFHHALV